MKEGIHPKYKPVVFFDPEANFKVLTRSTLAPKETIEFEGKEYPVVKVEISSASHPFYTGQEKFVDAAGRVERFQKKFGGEYFAGKSKPKPTTRPKL